jgi:hypothetical protein
MKIIINSSNVMRNSFTNLVQIEDGDGAVRMVDGQTDWFQHHVSDTYLIEHFLNQQRSIKSYVKINAQFAEKLMEMSIDEAYRTMNEYIFM